MFPRAAARRKDDKFHRYWSIVENRRVSRGPALQKTVLYLGEIAAMRLSRNHLLLKLGAARRQSPSAWRPVEIEEVFRNIKGDLAIRPIRHELQSRIEAHAFVTFLAYCLHVTLAQRHNACAGGWTPRSALEQLAPIQMIDVAAPTADDRRLEMSRVTQPDKSRQLALAMLGLRLPPHPPPKLLAPETARSSLPARCPTNPSVVKTFAPRKQIFPNVFEDQRP